jgi:predicted MPP superfamily phosphohydrolase
MTTADREDRRASDHGAFSIAIAIVLLVSHLWLYRTSLKQAPLPLIVAWGALGVIAASSAVFARLWRSLGRKPHITLIHGCAAAWNVFVTLTAASELVIFTLTSAPSRAASFALSCALALLVCAYGFSEAMTTHVTFLRLGTASLPKGVNRLRIAQLSDLHIGPFMSLPHISRVVKTTLSTSPDLIVITGDLIDGATSDSKGTLPFYEPGVKIIRVLSEAAPRLGVWAVPGNHDYYGGFEGARDFMEKSGVHLLKGEKIDLGDIVLVGADDLDHLRESADNTGMSESERIINSLTPAEGKKFVLLLRHRPVVERRTIGAFDLQLSGHTHGGQLFALPSSRHRIPGRPRGYAPLGAGSYIYVSNGAGFVGPPMRFLAPAEIVVIDLEREEI